MTSRGLLGTSVLIARESGRAIDLTSLPEQGHLSVATLAEVQAGALAARDTDVRASRLATLQAIASITVLDVDAAAAAQWARLRVRLHETGRRVEVNDSLIAAIAIAHDLPVYAQDSDFDVLAEIGLLEVVRV